MKNCRDIKRGLWDKGCCTSVPEDLTEGFHELVRGRKWKQNRMGQPMATHSSALAWKIPWMEEPGRLQSMGSLRVGHDWATSLSFFIFMHWRRKWQPTPVFLPGESQGRGAWWAAIYGVAQSRTDWSDLAAAAAAAIISRQEKETKDIQIRKKDIKCLWLQTTWSYM